MPPDEKPLTNRRDILKGSALLVPMMALSGPAALAEADPKPGAIPTGIAPGVRSAPAADHPTEASYQPTYFTPAEWAFVNAACARIIPEDEHGPGAVKLGVPQFIDRQMSTAWADGGIWYMQGPFIPAKPEFGYQSQLTPKQQYRLGIKAINDLCQKQSKQDFAALPADQQDDVLHKIEKGELKSPDIPLGTFFSGFLLKNVMEGYFGDPMYGGNKDMGAWAMIAYPGVRADYLEWVGEAKPYPYGPVSIHGARS
jgi:gluconate 2-dehydrogenase gamma chain